MLFTTLGNIKMMGLEGLFRLWRSNYTQWREYQSVQNQLVGEISCGSNCFFFFFSVKKKASLTEQLNSAVLYAVQTHQTWGVLC